MVDHTSNDIQLGIKATLGDGITRKYLNDGIAQVRQESRTKSARYKIPMMECKSWVELDDGSRIDEADYDEIKAVLELTGYILQLAKLHLSES